MASSKPEGKAKSAAIAALCAVDHATFPVALAEITPDGCSAEADAEWLEDAEFLHLTIDDRIEINGSVSWHKGRRAHIQFFGQIHPTVIDKLVGLAA